MAKPPQLWQKGQSGNPAGRPPKVRALTAILERAGDRPVMFRGEQLAGKEVVATMLWELATTFQAQLPSGRYMQLSNTDEYIRLVTWIFSHIDGPARSAMDMGFGEEGSNRVEVVFVNGNAAVINQLVPPGETERASLGSGVVDDPAG